MARKDKPEKILKIHMKPAPRLGEDEDKVQQKTDERLARMGERTDQRQEDEDRSK